MEQTTNLTANLSMNASTDANGTMFYPAFPIGPDFYQIYNWYLYVMIALGVVGNFVVLVVFIRHPPSTTTDWFIVFITVCDFVSSFINVPVYATFTNGYWRLYGTTLLCRLHMFISQSLVLSSSFLISGLALDRYIKVCRQSVLFSKARARNVCFLISIVTSILSTPCFVMYENQGGRCVSVAGTDLYVYYFMVFLIFVVATILVVFSYYKVTKAVMKSEMNVARHKGGERIFNTCCLLPAFRRNKIGPASTTLTRSGVFKDTVIVTSDLDVSAVTENAPVKDRNTLTVPAKKSNMNSGAFPVSDASGSNEIEEPGSKTSLTEAKNTTQKPLSTAPKVQANNNSRLVSLRTTRISFLVCSVFIVTWIPPWLSFIFATIPSMMANIEVIKFMIFGRMTYLINGMTNPIIYTWLNRKFRNHIFEIFCRQKFQ